MLVEFMDGKMNDGNLYMINLFNFFQKKVLIYLIELFYSNAISKCLEEKYARKTSFDYAH